ncbi:MAG: hypothetical protein WCT12_19855 [Verrucomicrobiota bacterium]|jgi:hypothetical protein
MELHPLELAEAVNPTCAICGQRKYRTELARQLHGNQHASRHGARKPTIMIRHLDTPTCRCAKPDFSRGEELFRRLTDSMPKQTTIVAQFFNP